VTDSLFTPFSLRGTEFRNRVMLSPMCQYSAKDGLANEWHRIHLGTRAVGGAGMVMMEATAVEPGGRITPHDHGIWSDEHAERLEPITEFMHAQGATPGIQLAHAGRKASTDRPWDGGSPIQPDDGGWEALAPSAAPYPHESGTVPTRRMDKADIDNVIEQFGAAAERALAAGFEVAEVHAAHGYLLHEFLSPVTNDRDDEYGGRFENRTRLVREVTERVRSVWPDDKPVFVRISASDWLPDRSSWDIEQSVRLADSLGELGADLIDVSGGGIHPDQQIPSTGPGYQVPYAEQIRAETEMAVAAVGGITEPEHADALVRNERTDLVALGREMLRNPYWPLQAAHELGEEIEWPPQYRRGRFERA
jgi:2,4-dienoyl-CoA reductase-like NADH-dependent reductase (Old Yellow Enzyme family)